MATITWANSVSGYFGSAADWTGGSVPGAGDDAILGALDGSSFTVTANAKEAISGIETAANAELLIIGVDLAASLGSDGGSNAGAIVVRFGTFEAAGTIDGDGTIDLVAGGLLVAESAGLTLAGGGTVKLQTGGVFDALDISSSGGAGNLTNVNDTILGQGAIGGTSYSLTFDNAVAGVVSLNGAAPNGGVYYTSEFFDASLTNAGLIKSTDKSGTDIRVAGVLSNSGTIENLGATMEIGLRRHSPSLSISNTGLIEALSGSTMLLDSGQVDGSGGGIILAGNGSQVRLKSTTLTGGTLKTSGTGVITTTDSGSELNGSASAVNNQGAFSVAAGDSLAVTGAINNTGTVSLGSSAALVVDGATTFSGTGKVVLAADGTNRILAGGAGASLTNGQNISGAGDIGAGVTLVNQVGGTINANAASPLTIALSGVTAVNGGLIEATAGGGLTLSGFTLDNAGGTVGALGGAVTLKGMDLAGGTLKSSGAGVIHVQTATLDGTAGQVTSSGALSVNSGGSLTVMGTLANSGTLTLNGATLTVGTGGLTLTGKGKLLLNYSASNLITGSTLTNAGNIIFGAGDIGGGTMSLINDAGATIKATDATPLIIDTGASTIVNAGTIEAAPGGIGEVMSAVANSQWLYAAGGTLTVEGAVTGTGKGLIKSGVLDFESSFNQIVSFIGTSGRLVLAQSQAFTNFIRGFSKAGGTSLDLKDIAFGGGTTASYSGTTASGVLTVTDGTHTASIHLQGDYTGSTFTVSNDGSGGTLVVDPPAGTAAPLTQAMASFSHGPPPHLAGTPAYRLPRLPIFHVRA